MRQTDLAKIKTLNWNIVQWPYFAPETHILARKKTYTIAKSEITSSSQCVFSVINHISRQNIFCRDHIALSLLPVGLKRAGLFLWERKVLQHMLALNNHHGPLFFRLCSTTRAANVMFFLLLVFLHKYFGVLHSCERLEKKIKYTKQGQNLPRVLQCTEKTFHQHFWNSWSRCHFGFVFNLKATPQMLKLLAISCNVSFRKLSFFWTQAGDETGKGEPLHLLIQYTYIFLNVSGDSVYSLQ